MVAIGSGALYVDGGVAVVVGFEEDEEDEEEIELEASEALVLDGMAEGGTSRGAVRNGWRGFTPEVAGCVAGVACGSGCASSSCRMSLGALEGTPASAVTAVG